MPQLFPLAIDGDFYYKFSLTNPDGSAKSGLADVTVSASETDGGAPITGLTKYAASEVGTGTGIYAATFPESDLASNLASLIGAPAFVVVYEGVKVLSSDPCVITAAARAG